jgi:hypothetical protein
MEGEYQKHYEVIGALQRKGKASENDNSLDATERQCVQMRHLKSDTASGDGDDICAHCLLPPASPTVCHTSNKCHTTLKVRPVIDDNLTICVAAIFRRSCSKPPNSLRA